MLKGPCAERAWLALRAGALLTLAGVVAVLLAALHPRAAVTRSALLTAPLPAPDLARPGERAAGCVTIDGSRGVEPAREPERERLPCFVEELLRCERSPLERASSSSGGAINE